MTQISETVPVTDDDGAVFAGTDVPVKRLFHCLEETHNLNIFLRLFPSVSREQALEAMEEQIRADAAEIIHSRKEIMSGWPVFKGTRLVVKNLFDYLAGGHTLDEFLDDFPSANREQAVRALEVARRILEKDAYEIATVRDSLIHSDPRIMSGMPVFKGTRLPVRNLFDYLAGGDGLDIFLEDFPSANRREQVLEALGAAREALESYVYETVAR